MNYNKKTIAELTELLAERKIKLRTKIKGKDDKIKILQQYDTDPSKVPALVKELLEAGDVYLLMIDFSSAAPTTVIFTDKNQLAVSLCVFLYDKCEATLVYNLKQKLLDLIENKDTGITWDNGDIIHIRVHQANPKVITLKKQEKEVMNYISINELIHHKDE